MGKPGSVPTGQGQYSHGGGWRSPGWLFATGQLWGNPLYRWEAHRATGYQWWITRLWYCFELYDVVRIDHFRGFDEYFSIPYGSETAAPGHWEKGPGIELFRAVEQALGKREIIAEDLGYMSDTVRQLVRDSGFPGMKVLEFAFDSRDTGSASDYLPHNYPVNSVPIPAPTTTKRWYPGTRPSPARSAPWCGIICSTTPPRRSSSIKA